MIWRFEIHKDLIQSPHPVPPSSEERGIIIEFVLNCDLLPLLFVREGGKGDEFLSLVESNYF